MKDERDYDDVEEHKCNSCIHCGKCKNPEACEESNYSLYVARKY